MMEVTFKDFSKLMAKRKRSVDDLVDLFRGKLDDNRNFFERVMSCQWRDPETGRYEDRSDVVIPYRSVIDFYLQELAYLKDTEEEEQRQTVKRKRGPVSEERREALRAQLAKARGVKVSQDRKMGVRPVEIIEEVT